MSSRRGMGGVYRPKYKDAKAVLLIFWATWSQRSLLELEDLKKLEEKYREQGLRILAVNVENQSLDDEDLRGRSRSEQVIG